MSDDLVLSDINGRRLCGALMVELALRGRAIHAGQAFSFRHAGFAVTVDFNLKADGEGHLMYIQVSEQFLGSRMLPAYMRVFLAAESAGDLIPWSAQITNLREANDSEKAWARRKFPEAA